MREEKEIESNLVKEDSNIRAKIIDAVSGTNNLAILNELHYNIKFDHESYYPTEIMFLRAYNLNTIALASQYQTDIFNNEDINEKMLQKLCFMINNEKGL